MSEIPDALIRFIQVLAEDDDLRAWFESISAEPEERREAELLAIAGKMEAAGEEPELIAATRLLANSDVFAGARAALQEAMEGR